MSSPEPGLVTRPRVEIYGRRAGYGFAGLGVSTAFSARLVPEGPTGPVTFYDEDGRVLVFTPDGDGGYRRPQDLDADLARHEDGTLTLTFDYGETWSFDATGRLTRVTDPTGAVTRYEYDAAGNLTSLTDPLGRTTGLGYDAAGNLITVTDPEGGVTRYAYDPGGRCISATTPAGLTTRFERDAAGRVSAVVNPRGWITRFEDNSRGEKTAIIHPSGAVQRNRYNAEGQLTEVIDPNGSVTRYGYDDAGRLAVITDAKDAVTRLGYDANGRQTSCTDPLGRTARREYDKAGNLTAVTNPSGRTVHMEYDEDHRLIRRRAGDEVVSYGYDSAGRRTSMTDGTGTTRYAYDKAGRLLKTTYPDGDTVSRSYDAAGQQTALTYPSGLELRYSYNLNGRLVGLHDPRAGDAAYALDPDGRLITEQLPDGEARRYHYQDGLLHSFQVFRRDRPVAVTSFTRDPDGRILTEHDGHREREYRYDPAGQLVYSGWRDDDRDGAHIAYDVTGNRVSLRRGGTEARFRYDDADQLLGIQVRGHHLDRHLEFRYDSSGRVTEKIDGERRSVVEYDGFGLPVAVTRHEPEYTEHVRATYNGDGLITALVLGMEHPSREREKATSIRYLWGAGRVPQILAQRAEPRLEDVERDRSGRLDADFAYGYGRTFASWEHGGATFHHDAHGSAIRTEDTGPWVQADRYDIFGEPVEPEPRADHEHDEPEHHGLKPPEFPRFGYRGELSLGHLQYLRTRIYDSALGRFISRDPVPVQGGPGYAANPYTYAGNDPLRCTGPDPAELPGGAAELTTGDPGQRVPGHPDRGAVRREADRLLPRDR